MKVKKRWAIIAVSAVIVLVLTGLIGSIVSAQSPTVPNTPPPERSQQGDEYLARVAEILDIDQDDLKAAMKQAAQEMMDQRVQERIDKLVEQGKLTEEEANEYMDWWESRPDVPEGWNGFAGKFFRGGFGHFDRNGFNCGPQPRFNQVPAIPEE